MIEYIYPDNAEDLTVDMISLDLALKRVRACVNAGLSKAEAIGPCLLMDAEGKDGCNDVATFNSAWNIVQAEIEASSVIETPSEEV